MKQDDYLEMEMKLIKNKLVELNKKNEIMEYKLNLIYETIIAKDGQDMNLCPICGEISLFKPFGIIPREHAQCPNCGSLERHRLIYLFLKLRYSDLINSNVKLLHFAPEDVYYNLFKKSENIDYFPVDMFPEIFESRGIDIRCKVNMEDIPFPDNTFHIILNSHVLEHVPDDMKAMEEVYRVLNPEGVCLIMVPLSGKYETLEDDNFNTPELRLKYYGQSDHLRLYGRDIRDKLKSVGFNVEEVHSKDIYKTSIKREFYGLSASAIIFLCTK